ncbi:hypothetical protein AHAS_Ahas20G0174800 [Arachis hypogaea]
MNRLGWIVVFDVVLVRRRVVPSLILIAPLCIIPPPLIVIIAMRVVVLAMRGIGWTVVVVDIGYGKGVLLLNLVTLIRVMCGARAQTTNSRRAFKLSNLG